jgi:hypothetical protein
MARFLEAYSRAVAKDAVDVRRTALGGEQLVQPTSSEQHGAVHNHEPIYQKNASRIHIRFKFYFLIAF